MARSAGGILATTATPDLAHEALDELAHRGGAELRTIDGLTSADFSSRFCRWSESVSVHGHGQPPSGSDYSSIEEWLREAPRTLWTCPGSFAVVSRAPATNGLVAATDFAATKPLHCTVGPAGAAIATEPRAAALAAGRSSAPDHISLRQYRESGGLSRTRSFHDGVMRLPPASIARWSPGDTSWQITSARLTAARPLANSMTEAGEIVRRSLLEAIHGQPLASGTIGALVSGGLDSTGVACLVSASGFAIDRTVTARVPSVDGIDETAYARSAATRYGWELDVLDLTPEDYWDQAAEIAKLVGPTHPTGGGAAISLARAATADIVFTGQFADEWIGTHTTTLAGSILDGDLAHAARLISFARQTKSSTRGVASILGRSAAGALLRANRLPDVALQRVHDPRMRLVVQLEETIAAHAGATVAMPFADVAVAVAMAGLPARYKSVPWVTKAALREAIRQFTPDEVIERTDKMNFYPIVAAAVGKERWEPSAPVYRQWREHMIDAFLSTF